MIAQAPTGPPTLPEDRRMEDGGQLVSLGVDSCLVIREASILLQNINYPIGSTIAEFYRIFLQSKCPSFHAATNVQKSSRKILSKVLVTNFKHQNTFPNPGCSNILAMSGNVTSKSPIR
jgi:hypothetical protein